MFVFIFAFHGWILALMRWENSRSRKSAAACEQKNLRLFELARVLVRLDHVASFIVNANHSVA
jgi:hypothetical protein